MRSEISHFHLDALRKGLETMRVDDVQKAYDALRGGKVNFAVLWEPLVSKARSEIPGAHVLIDTSKAQGLVIDIALASRQIVDKDPALVETFTHAYFEALHDYLNKPPVFNAAAAYDSSKSEADAETMLRGIRFATLEDNATDWLQDSQDSPAHLAASVRQIQAILRDHQQTVDLPNDEPNAILRRATIQLVAKNRGNIAALAGAAATNANANNAASAHGLGGYYPPLTPAQWDDLSKQVRGTLLDEPIVFPPGRSDVPDDFKDQIRDAAPKLANYPNFRVVVEAHVAPGDDTPEADRALSEARSLAVKQFLMWECHVPEDRILARGKGSDEPPQRFPDESEASFGRRARRARIFLVGQ